MAHDSNQTSAAPDLDALRTQLDAQAEVIAALEARLSTLESPATATEPPVDAQPSEPPTGTRRDLLTKAAAATVGAVATGAALAIGQATPAAAAAGIFDGNPGVKGVANPTNGVGVRGEAVGGIGTEGISTTSWGLYGYSSTGYALALESGLGTHVRLLPGNDEITAKTYYSHMGALYLDSSADLWICVSPGAPGTWHRLGGPSSSGALTVLPAPVRVYDSRPGELPNLGIKLPLNGERTCDLKANASGVPAGATAVMVSLGVTKTTGAAGGFLTVWKNGLSRPLASNLTWFGPGQGASVTTVTAVDANAVCKLFANAQTDVIVDVLGYYR